MQISTDRASAQVAQIAPECLRTYVRSLNQVTTDVARSGESVVQAVRPMPRLRRSLVPIVLAAAGGAGLAGGSGSAVMAVPAASAAGCPGAHTVPSATSLSRARRATLCLVGRERARHGLAPLRLDRHLRRAAQRHAKNMVLRGYLGHNGPDGGITSRIERSGFPRGHRTWTAGETVGFGQFRLATPAAVVRSWLASPEHRGILLSPTYRWLGVGVVRGGPLVAPAGAATYVVDLGWRR